MEFRALRFRGLGLKGFGWIVIPVHEDRSLKRQGVGGLRKGFRPLLRGSLVSLQMGRRGGSVGMEFVPPLQDAGIRFQGSGFAYKIGHHQQLAAPRAKYIRPLLFSLFQLRCYLLKDWLLKHRSRLGVMTKTALGYYVMGLLAAITTTGVKPFDYGATKAASCD